MNILFKENEVFKALSEEIRLRIAVLLTEGELCVCDLIAVLALPQSTVSRHMSKLKHAGIIADRREGKWVHYHLTVSKIHNIPELTAMLRSFRSRSLYQEDLNKLSDHLKTKKCN